MTATDPLPWLLAQLDADEQKAQAATPGPWRIGEVEHGSTTVDGPDALQDGGPDPEAPHRRRQVMRPRVVIPPDCDYGPTVDLADAQHIATHDPARVLRQVAAMRLIVAEHGDQHECTDRRASEYPYVGCRTLRLVASVYADRPGFDPRWAPEEVTDVQR